jgi:hypothetical protein
MYRCSRLEAVCRATVSSQIVDRAQQIGSTCGVERSAAGVSVPSVREHRQALDEHRRGEAHRLSGSTTPLVSMSSTTCRIGALFDRAPLTA